MARLGACAGAIGSVLALAPVASARVLLVGSYHGHSGQYRPGSQVRSKTRPFPGSQARV